MTNPLLKAPDERQDYTVDWEADGYLAEGETISTSDWTFSDPLIQFGSDTKTSTTATIWLTGGIHGEEYTVTNEILTTDGRIAERSIKILCRNR